MTDASPLTIGDAAGPVREIEGRSLWADARRRLLANRAAMSSLVILTLIAVASVIGPLLSPHGFDQIYRSHIRVPPSLTAYPKDEAVPDLVDEALRRSRATVEDVTITGDLLRVTLTGERELDPRLVRGLERSGDFSGAQVLETGDDGRRLLIEATIERHLFLLGTDSNGRDLLTRIFLGGRISLMIGLLATAVSIVIGVTYGAIAGYLGGRADHIMMRVVDILYAIPFMFFVILLMVFFGRNIVLIFIAVGAIEWLDMARIVRGQTLSLKRKEFIEAAIACGVRRSTVIRRHIVPNALGPVAVYMTLMVPKVILLESFLSFLGLGVQEPMTSWGVLIADGANNMVAAPWMLISPAIVLATSLFCLNFIGDGLRDALDPKDR